MRYLFLYLLILLIPFVCSCEKSSKNQPDGDSDSIENVDNDKEKSDVEAFDPCTSVDCSPGTCRVQESLAICDCPSGYSQETLTKCVPLNEDGDIVEKEEHECEPLYESGPFAGLCECDYKAENFPCIPEVEFNYTNDKGEFRIGKSGSSSTEGISINNGKIGYDYSYPFKEDIWTPSGVFMFDYKDKSAVLVESTIGGTMYTDISENQFVWERVDEWKDYDCYKGSLWKTDLQSIKKVKISSSDTAKYQVKSTSNGIYWLAAKKSTGDSAKHLYTLNESNEEIRVDKLGNSILSFVANEDWIAYQNGSSEIVTININTNVEKVIISQKPFIADIALWGNNLYYSDGTYSSIMNCGVTLWEYDLVTSKKEAIKLSDGYHDYYISDAWEDWILFENCDETFDETNPRSTCCNKTNGDVYLYNVKTKEEWNISNHSGDQIMSRIWDNLIVWRDGRHKEKVDEKEYPKQDLYGIDLCKHPELKDRFPSCKTKR